MGPAALNGQYQPERLTNTTNSVASKQVTLSFIFSPLFITYYVLILITPACVPKEHSLYKLTFSLKQIFADTCYTSGIYLFL